MGPCNLSGPASLKTQVKSDRELSFDSWSAVFVKLITYVKPVSECSPSTQRNDWCLCLVWTCAGGTSRETEKTRQIRTPFYSVSTAPPEESEDKWARSLVVYVCVYPLHTPPGHTQLQCVVQSAIHFPPIQNSIFLLFLSQEFKISQWSWPKLDQESIWQLCLHRSRNANRAYNGSPSATTARHVTSIFLSMSTLFCNHNSRNEKTRWSHLSSPCLSGTVPCGTVPHSSFIQSRFNNSLHFHSIFHPQGTLQTLVN